jgi:DinB family protein
MPAPRPAAITSLLDAIDEAFDRRAWHGTNLRGSIRGLTAAQASWRPAPRRHNVWELVVHAAYWKYAVRRRITRAKRGSFSLKGSNWFVRPGAGDRGPALAAAWRRDIALLEAEHARLRAAVAGLDPRTLERSRKGSATSLGALLRGIAAHDLYHAGQIQLLKRLSPR